MYGMVVQVLKARYRLPVQDLQNISVDSEREFRLRLYRISGWQVKYIFTQEKSRLCYSSRNKSNKQQGI